jgi:predicted extracellular nuclease
LDPDARIVVLGDLNDHEFRTPLRVLTGAPLENLVLRLSPEDRYSFNFRGNSQLLDHILVSRSLVERARARIDIVHVNSDRAAARSSSDHDPLIVELDFSSNE